MPITNIIPLIDIFYVAKQWVLIIDSKHQQHIDQTSKLALLDENLQLITTATIAFYPMGNRNPNIFDIAINVNNSEVNLKTTKHIKLLK